jgi:hypothetical protein
MGPKVSGNRLHGVGSCCVGGCHSRPSVTMRLCEVLQRCVTQAALHLWNFLQGSRIIHLISEVVPEARRRLGFVHKPSVAFTGLSCCSSKLTQQLLGYEPFWCSRLTHHGCVATPAPLLWTLDHASTHRIKNYGPYEFQEIGIAVNQNSRIAPLKDVTCMSMVPIEALCVDSMQLPHTYGQIGIRRLNHEVIVVSHQAVGITHPSHAPTNVTEYLEKAFSVPLV